MQLKREQMRLYAVTDRTWLRDRTLEGQVELALRGGVTFVQLREKGLPLGQLAEQARRLKALCARYGAPFVVNDSVEAALASGADGVHVGQDDLEAGRARAMLGPDKILGVTAHTVEEALRAQDSGADYIGVGAVFPTQTKGNAIPMAHETLPAICSAVTIPVIAIGGITCENLPKLSGCGLDGVAVVSALFAQPDIYQAAKELRALSEEMAAGLKLQMFQRELRRFP